jgi:hypothetical protein
VLEYDHLDGTSKEANVSGLQYAPSSLMRLQAEMDKCVVRCRNCHGIVTHERSFSASHRAYVARLASSWATDSPETAPAYPFVLGTEAADRKQFDLLSGLHAEG